MTYIHITRIDAKEFASVIDGKVRTMRLKRPISMRVAWGNHGDSALYCEELDIWGSHEYDYDAVSKSFADALFARYDFPSAYDDPKSVKFRSLIEQVTEQDL